MTEERIRFRRKKQVLTLAHIFFVLIAVFGISAKIGRASCRERV